MLIRNTERPLRSGERGRKSVEQQCPYRATIPESLHILPQVMGGANVLLASTPRIAPEDP